MPVWLNKYSIKKHLLLIKKGSIIPACDDVTDFNDI